MKQLYKPLVVVDIFCENDFDIDILDKYQIPTINFCFPVKI